MLLQLTVLNKLTARWALCAALTNIVYIESFDQSCDFWNCWNCSYCWHKYEHNPHSCDFCCLATPTAGLRPAEITGEQQCVSAFLHHTHPHLHAVHSFSAGSCCHGGVLLCYQVVFFKLCFFYIYSSLYFGIKDFSPMLTKLH